MILWIAALAFADPARETWVPLGGAAGDGGLGPRGAVIRHRPVIDGIPVDVARAVWLDAAGRVRGVYDRPLPAADRIGSPIPPEEARDRASRMGPGVPRARISWQDEGGVLRRVWTVEVGPRVVRLDAVSGGVLSVDELTGADVPLARAYVHNPVIDPDPAEVALPLAVDALSDDRVEARNCLDLGEIRTVELDSGSWDFHVCTPVLVERPADGDYLFDPVPYPGDGGRDEDAFAAPHVYWNVHEGLAWFDGLGWAPSAEFLDPRLVVTVNQRDTDLSTIESSSDPDAALIGFDNAYSTGGYLDGDEEWVLPELVFGQGTEVDFGYDADVVHHELGHYIVRSLGGPSRSGPGPYGPSVRANSLNEGFADYFSSAIHGDPALGEYVALERGAIRDLAGSDTCDDLLGESHYDGLPFVQPLWQLRETLTEPDRAILDAAVLDSLPLLGTGPDFADAAAVIEDLVAERLGPATADLLVGEWESRGIYDCPPVVEAAAGAGAFRRFTLLPGSYDGSVAGEIPGYLQFRTDVPEGGARLTLTFLQLEYLGLDPYGIEEPMPLEIIGRSGLQLTWERVDAGTETAAVDWVSDGAPVGLADRVGTPEPLASDPAYAVHSYAASWDVREAGSYVFQLANSHPRPATAYELVLAVVPGVPPAAVQGIYRGGSGCQTADRGAALAPLLALLIALGSSRRAAS
ncbi:MAG: hypothetical protein H0V89_01760 [Deltaproteobacteria bacterium]|nr:hypothetical protein [Deltaproteobacteria bacterium]